MSTSKQHRVLGASGLCGRPAPRFSHFCISGEIWTSLRLRFPVSKWQYLGHKCWQLQTPLVWDKTEGFLSNGFYFLLLHKEYLAVPVTFKTWMKFKLKYFKSFKIPWTGVWKYQRYHSCVVFKKHFLIVYVYLCPHLPTYFYWKSISESCWSDTQKEPVSFLIFNSGQVKLVCLCMTHPFSWFPSYSPF